jgi:hypothetical protein
VPVVFPPTAPIFASNHSSCNISALPTTVKRAELRACIAETRESCEPTANTSSTASVSSLGL